MPRHASPQNAPRQRGLRVAYVVYRFDKGGLERCVAHLCNHLDRSRFQPLVVCLTESGGAQAWLKQPDVEVLEVRKRPGNDPLAVLRLRSLIRSRQIDVVHSHNWGTLLECTLACAGGLAAHVHAERGTILNQLNRNGWRYRLRSGAMRWALQRCDAVVSNAESTAARVRSLAKLPADGIEIIPNGIEAPRTADRVAARQTLRKRLGIPAEVYVIGSIARLHAVKNFAMAINALAEEPLSTRGVHLLLVGDGPERAALAAHAADRHVSDRVHLVGEQSEIGDWLAAMDVFVNTSVSEGMSQSIVEAMSVGLPLIVTDVGDSANLVAGESPCGIVIASENSCALIQAVCDLMLDPRQGEHLGLRAAQRYSELYSLPPMVSAYETLYSRLAGEGDRTLSPVRGAKPRSAITSSAIPREDVLA